MSKWTMLNLLRDRPGEFVSGEQVSERLGLSRAAIWKAVTALRKAGFVIEARTGRGYRLVSEPNLLTEEEIRRYLPEEAQQRTICCFEEIDSTNTYAKQIALTGAAEGTVVVADCQTAGRGRMSRRFQSPKGKGTYLTMILRPKLPTEQLLPITALAGVAVCEAVERTCGIRPQLKWPNDPVVNRKKICGILTEVEMESDSGCLQYMVVGIGVNILHQPEDFGEDVRPMATSLQMETGEDVSRPKLTAELIFALDKLYAALCRGDISEYLAVYRRDCVNLGKTVQLIWPDGSRKTVQAVDVDDQFGLVVEDEQGQQTTVRSGEVSVRGMYGYVE